MTRQTISVRMYNVGFGDAFLVQLPGTDGKPRHILIDCGVHARGARLDWPMEAIVSRVLDDVSEITGTPTIDVVVATHRHADHISGFGDERWDSVRVGEVWMPWTEDPDDGEALGLAARRTALAQGLAGVLEARQRPLSDLALEMLGDVLAASNGRALQRLREGFAPLPGKRRTRRRYLSAGSRPFLIPGTDGARVHVLGPGRDSDALRELEPPGEQRYFAAAPGLAGDGGERRPFDDRFCCDEAKVPDLSALIPQGERDDIASLVDDPEGLAGQQYSASNDSSLLLAIEMGRAVLVLAGDAEWRSWRAVLANPDARTLLGRTSLLKVAHHGSYNGTPVELVEEVLPEKPLWALVSTQEGRPFESIPRARLLTALRRRGARVLRSDGVDLPRDVPSSELVAHADGSSYDVHIPI